MKIINFRSVKEFNRELNKLSKKKCRSLHEDIELLKSALHVKIPDSVHTIPISNLGESVKIPVYKVRRFRCKNIKKGSNSGFRLIYAYIEDSSTILFLELYFKGNHEKENRERIYKYCKEEIME